MKITCPQCNKEIEIDKALEGQIETRILAEESKKHEAEIADIKKQTAKEAERKLQNRLELEKQKMQQELELEHEKAKLRLDGEAKKREQKQEQLLKNLQEEAAEGKKENTELRDQLKKLFEELRAERSAKENAELEAKKKLNEEEQKIREEVRKAADEEHRLKQLETEKKLQDTQKALEEAQRKAGQGSQQNQGEVLELDLEQRLRDEFPFDEIEEVKKGVKGADIKQYVRNRRSEDCGLLLWETKNGKWQPAWVKKFKEDIRDANANIGVIVSKELPAGYGTMINVEGNVWVVKPELALSLGVALRSTIIQVFAANSNAVGKDQKMEVLYQYLIGPEFRHRIESIVEHYGFLQDEIEKEKRAAQLRWSRQEKSIRMVIDSTIGMYGDLQGITGSSLQPIKALEEGSEAD